jgi:transcriptional regulator with XRE-family HTH domain
MGHYFYSMDIAEELQFVVQQIKKLRVQHGISQFELSLRANISQSFLANLERGKKQPSVLTIIKIATALEVHPKDFFPVKAVATDKRSMDKEPIDKQRIKDEIISLLNYL